MPTAERKSERGENASRTGQPLRGDGVRNDSSMAGHRRGPHCSPLFRRLAMAPAMSPDWLRVRADVAAAVRQERPESSGTCQLGIELGLQILILPRTQTQCSTCPTTQRFPAGIEQPEVEMFSTGS